MPSIDMPIKSLSVFLFVSLHCIVPLAWSYWGCSIQVKPAGWVTYMQCRHYLLQTEGAAGDQSQIDKTRWNNIKSLKSQTLDRKSTSGVPIGTLWQSGPLYVGPRLVWVLRRGWLRNIWLWIILLLYNLFNYMRNRSIQNLKQYRVRIIFRLRFYEGSTY